MPTIELPPPPPGPPSWKRAYVALKKAIQAITPVGTDQCDVVDVPGGKAFIPRFPPRVAGGDEAESVGTPWTISVNNVSGSYFLDVAPGVVNEFLPSNIFIPFAIGAGTWLVKVRADTDGKVVNGAQIEIDVNPITPTVTENVAPPMFRCMLGVVVMTVNVDGSLTANVFQVRRNNISAIPSVVMLVTRTPPQPGDEPFTRWFEWQDHDIVNF